MNDLAWLIYWADVLPNFKGLLGAAAFMSLFAIAGAGTWTAYLVTELDKPMYKAIGWPVAVLTFTIVSSVSAALIPTKETMYLMAGANTLPTLASTPEVDKVRQIINNKLDGLLESSEDEEEQQDS